MQQVEMMNMELGEDDPSTLFGLGRVGRQPLGSGRGAFGGLMPVMIEPIRNRAKRRSDPLGSVRGSEDCPWGLPGGKVFYFRS